MVAICQWLLGHANNYLSHLVIPSATPGGEWKVFSPTRFNFDNVQRSLESRQGAGRGCSGSRSQGRLPSRVGSRHLPVPMRTITSLSPRHHALLTDQTEPLGAGSRTISSNIALIEQFGGQPAPCHPHTSHSNSQTQQFGGQHHVTLTADFRDLHVEKAKQTLLPDVHCGAPRKSGTPFEPANLCAPNPEPRPSVARGKSAPADCSGRRTLSHGNPMDQRTQHKNHGRLTLLAVDHC